MGSLSGWEAVKIAQQSYETNLKEVPVVLDGKRIAWNRVEQPIVDKKTGLKGYVLQNEKPIKL